MNKKRLLAALAIAVVLFATFCFGCLVSRLLNCLPFPWDLAVLAVVGITIIVYIWLDGLLKKGGKNGED